MTDLRRPAPLDLARHKRDDFRSGEEILDDWLRHYADQSRRRDTAAVWVIADVGFAVVAYATLSMTGVDRSAAPSALIEGAPDPVPSLLIGRLAVDERYNRLGIGTELVKHLLATAVELNTRAACRAVVVTALNATARSWWERFGFAPFDPEDPEGLDLYLMTKDIEATLRM